MNKNKNSIAELSSIRNQFGIQLSQPKKQLLGQITIENHASITSIQEYYRTLLFIAAHPDNEEIYDMATEALKELCSFIDKNERIKRRLYNSGVAGTTICAAFGFELVKWLRGIYKNNIDIESIEADEGTITYILSAVMPKVESEILQDANYDWKTWLKLATQKGSAQLDTLIGIFSQTDVRPEVKDELWNALHINISIQLPQQTVLPPSLFKPYYHKELIKKPNAKQRRYPKPVKRKITLSEAEQIIECGRTILIRHIREIDPVTFCKPELVSYYILERGISIALMGMSPERRHPIDSYMGYLAFKNGLPVAYAGSWILFDSGRIGLNIFPSYRGGESAYIFEQILELHRQVYHLKRFSVDPYQIGKDNSDGIKSGAFWVYYHAGFRSIQSEQKKLAEEEAQKIQSIKGYRSSAAVLKNLANSRMELVMQKDAVRFDATDLSRLYLSIVQNGYRGNRKIAEQETYPKLVRLLQLDSAYGNEKLSFILKNWSVLLMTKEDTLRKDKELQIALKSIFEIKAYGSEEIYMRLLRRSKNLQKLLSGLVSAI